MFEDDTDRAKDQLADVRALDRLQRRQEFTVVCVFCGEVVALQCAGERIPDGIHVCPEQDALDREIESQMDRLREK